MKVKRLELRNYRCFEHITIDFPDGLYRIDGPNGIGKSSIVEAIRWIVWGRGRSPVMQRYIRRGEVAASGVIEIELMGQIIEASRSVTAKGGKFSVTVNGQPLGDNSREAQKLLEQKIGMDHDTFIATAFFVQKGDDMFTAATPAKRKEYLRKVLGLELFDRARKIAATRLRDEQVRLGEIETVIAGCPGLVEEREAKDDVQAARETLHTAKGKIDRLEVVEKQYHEQRVRLAKLAAEQKAREDARAAARRELEARRQVRYAKYEAKVSERNGVKTHIATVGSLLTSHITAVREGEHTVEKKTQSVQEFKRAISDMLFYRVSGTEIEKAKVVEAATTEVDNAARADVLRLQEKLKSLTAAHGSSLCPTCDSLLPEKKRVAHYEKAMKDLEQAENRRRESADAADAAHGVWQELDRKNTHNQEATRNRGGFEQQKALVMTELVEVKASLVRWKKAEVEQRSEKEKLEAKLAGMEEPQKPEEDPGIEEEAVKEMDLEKLVYFDPEDLKTAREEWETAVALDKQAEAAEKALHEEQNKVVEQKKRYKEITASADRLRKLEHAFGKDGVTALMMRSAVSDIECVSNDILQDLFPGVRVRLELDRELKSGEVRDGFEIELDTPTGPSWYEDMSGGEGTLVNLAIRLAVSWYLTKRTGTRIGILILDEVFAALDASNRQRAGRVLREVESKFEQVVVISRTGIREFIESGIQVVRNGDVSSVEVA